MAGIVLVDIWFHHTLFSARNKSYKNGVDLLFVGSMADEHSIEDDYIQKSAG
jgi:hypothetical protein